MKLIESGMVCRNVLGKAVYFEVEKGFTPKTLGIFTGDMPDFPVMLTQETVKSILPALQHFAETGELPQQHKQQESQHD